MLEPWWLNCCRRRQSQVGREETVGSHPGLIAYRLSFLHFLRSDLDLQEVMPMSRGHTLQDPYLNTLRRERVPESNYLVNGIKLQGQIESFDQFVVQPKNTDSKMVYKHYNATGDTSRSVPVRIKH